MQDGIIQIKTTQELDGAKDSTELVTQGQMSWNGSLITLSYEETDEHGPLVTTITADLTHLPGRIDLDRIGAKESRMTIEQGQRHHSIYNLGPCEFALGVYGELVDCRLTAQGGSLHMRYTLDINATYAGRNTVELSVSRA